MARAINFQPIAWFWDVYQRGLLDLDPPYQRRSVWNQDYKDFFVDTVLNGFPAPAIFLYQEITPEGVSRHSVVDGKQRLATLFDFAKNEFPVSEKATISRLRGKYFKDLDDDTKREFWKYQFAVEYLPSSDEKIINDVFDRINRNVAKLTPQELRHARFDGEFINEIESLTSWMLAILPNNFPLITSQSKKQMKDVELVAQLVLLVEEGPKSYSQEDLDLAFSVRDISWENKDETIAEFRSVVDFLRLLSKENINGVNITRTRYRNQADFYSLFGAINELQREGRELSYSDTAEGMMRFLTIVENPESRLQVKEANDYFEAARSASNDAGPRRTRINIIKSVVDGTIQL